MEQVRSKNVLHFIYYSENFKLVGIHLQTSLFLATVFSIPIFAVNWFCEGMMEKQHNDLNTKDLLILTGQSESVSALSGQFVKYLLFGYFPMVYHSVRIRQIIS
jgi:hypothetical protein